MRVDLQGPRCLWAGSWDIIVTVKAQGDVRKLSGLRFFLSLSFLVLSIAREMYHPESPHQAVPPITSFQLSSVTCPPPLYLSLVTRSVPFHQGLGPYQKISIILGLDTFKGSKEL